MLNKQQVKEVLDMLEGLYPTASTELVFFRMRPPHLGQRPGISTTRGLVNLHSG